MSEHNRDLDRLAGVLTLLLVFAMAARFAVSADTWWHLRAGEWIWQHKALPWVDHFSYTRAGAPWHYPGAPVEVLMYWLVRLGGLGMLGVWQAVMVTATFALVWDMSPGHPLLKAAVLLLGAVTASPHWIARPYLVTLFFTALFLWLLARWKATGARWALWLLPLLMVVWVNTHGGYILGLVWWGVYFVSAVGRCGWAKVTRNPQAALCRSVLPLAAVGVFLVVAMLLNPYGAEMLRYPAYTLHMEATKVVIAEWQSPDFHELVFWPLLGMLLLLVGGAALSTKQWALEEVLLAMGMVYMALNWRRNVDVFAVVTVPLLSRYWHDILAGAWVQVPHPGSKPSPWHPRINLALVALIAFAAFLKAGVNALPNYTAAQVEKTYPMGAVRFLKAHPSEGHLFNYYDWGGFLTWNLRQYPVFIDGRADLYGDDFIQQWLNVMQARPEWKSVLDYWHVDRVLIPPDTRLGVALQANDWRLLYHDDLCELYGR